MGVYIPNWSKPISCYHCPFADVYLGGSVLCQLLPPNDKSCPLVEVPVPHGRLADCDAVEECLKEVTDGKTKDYAMMLLDWAVSKRTVIEREDE